MELWNFKGKQNSITEALQIRLSEHAVISVTGAGGKTSLITAWARELAAACRRTVITTTTHMFDPACTAGTEDDPYAGIPVLYTEQYIADEYDAETGIGIDNKGGSSAGSIIDPDNVLKLIEGALDDYGIVIAASHDPLSTSKVTSPPDKLIDLFCDKADVVLIEADGSRRMPFKWPAQHEPVVPDRTDMTVCVAGLSAIGRTTEEVMYRARELPSEFRRSSVEGEHIVDEKLIFAVLSSPDGGQKGVRGDFRVFLNQADTEELRQTAVRLQMMFAVSGIQSAWGVLRDTCCV